MSKVSFKTKAKLLHIENPLQLILTRLGKFDKSHSCQSLSTVSHLLAFLNASYIDNHKGLVLCVYKVFERVVFSDNGK